MSHDSKCEMLGGFHACECEHRSQSPTPRTDAFILAYVTKTDWNWRHYSRQLERELNAAKAENEAMREAIMKAFHILSYYREFVHFLVDIPEGAWLETTEGKQVVEAIVKLQPFIK